MTIDFCEPGSTGIVLSAILLALVGGGTGWLGGLLARKAMSAGSAGRFRRFTAGWLVPILLGALGTRQFVRAFYGDCEAAAWGLLPGGAMLALVVIPVSGIAAFVVAVRRGARS